MSIENPEQKQVVTVEVAFLQQILNYLQTRPYVEVHQIVDVLIGKPKELNVLKQMNNTAVDPDVEDFHQSNIKS